MLPARLRTCTPPWSPPFLAPLTASCCPYSAKAIDVPHPKVPIFVGLLRWRASRLGRSARTRSGRLPSALGAPLEILELVRLHDPVRWLPEDPLGECLERARARGAVAADHEAGPSLGQRLQGVNVLGAGHAAVVETVPAIPAGA